MDLKLSLRLNVDELTNTHLETYEASYVTEDGGTRQTIRDTVRAQVPGLIEQLRESQTEGMTGEGGGTFGSKSPVNIDAFQTYALIASRAAEEYRRLTGTENHDTIEANIRGWAAHCQKDADELQYCLDVTDEWINQIQGMFQPARKWEMTEPCPTCEQRFSYEVEGDERVRKPALTVIAQPQMQAVCGNCGAEWNGEDECRFLEKVLRSEKDRRTA